ncbi:DNA-binding protein [Aeromonas caviae]|uniref:YbaK/EbsC family protein n=1 Tax=Aeromonas caviae TaxID=648 RepID=UPI0005379848|nr:YbaK/EbsC family protein [Aeromonas caviae]PNO54304.1 DNA-binding protein [Aeromonas caviae]QUM01106.1 YbaK/EbsC family protein [Aeromonas caviae]
MPLDAIHDFNRQLLTDLHYQRFEHEPILDYATDERVKARLGWQAEFSKTLFLKFKDGRFALLLTHRDGRLDSKAVKAALGAKPSICTADEMQTEIGCLPGAVCPFLPRADIPLLVDPVLMNHHAFTWTPGHPEQTFLLETIHLAGLLARLPCDVSYLPAP